MSFFRAPALRFLVVLLCLYVIFCSTAGVLLADGTLHPARRPITQQDRDTERELTRSLGDNLEDVSLTARDGSMLRAWLIRPRSGNGNAVILLHGLADNRVGMTGYARLMLAHGFNVLLPDARAHGASGGDLEPNTAVPSASRHKNSNVACLLASRSILHCISKKFQSRVLAPHSLR